MLVGFGFGRICGAVASGCGKIKSVVVDGFWRCRVQRTTVDLDDEMGYDSLDREDGYEPFCGDSYKTCWGKFAEGWGKPLDKSQRTGVQQNGVRDVTWGTTTYLNVDMSLSCTADFWAQTWGQTLYSGVAVTGFTGGKIIYRHCSGEPMTGEEIRKAIISGLSCIAAIPVWNIMQTIVGPWFGVAVGASEIVITFAASAAAAGIGEGPTQYCGNTLNLCWEGDRGEYLEESGGACRAVARCGGLEFGTSLFPGCIPGATWQIVYAANPFKAMASGVPSPSAMQIVRAVGGGVAIAAAVGAGNILFFKFSNGVAKSYSRPNFSLPGSSTSHISSAGASSVVSGGASRRNSDGILGSGASFSSHMAAATL